MIRAVAGRVSKAPLSLALAALLTFSSAISTNEYALGTACSISVTNATASTSQAASGLCRVRIIATSANATLEIPSGVTSVKLILIGGGGGGGAGGGNYWGGGGGGSAGGLLITSSFAVQPNQVIPISLGQGGAGGYSYNLSTTGSQAGTSTSFGPLTVAGGSGGANHSGQNGGNGGGPATTNLNGQISTQTGGASGGYRYGGGGGAGSAASGAVAVSEAPANGGAGYIEQFSGESVVYGQGGRGGGGNRNVGGHDLSNLVSLIAGSGGQGSDGGVNAVSRGAPGSRGEIVIFYSPVLSVTYEAAGATGSVPIDSAIYSVGDSVTILAPVQLEREGYDFLDWRSASSTLSPGAMISISGSITLTANWATRSYSISYSANANGQEIGSPPAGGAGLYSSSHVIQTSNLQRAGYQLTGWQILGRDPNVVLTASDSVIVSAEPLVLVASWSPNTYTVSFESAGGSQISDSSYRMGSPIQTPSSPQRSGYTFTGWSLTPGGALINFPFSVQTPGNITLHAMWTSASQGQGAGVAEVRYRGPSIEAITRSYFPGETVRITGSSLETVTQVEIDGVKCEISSISSNQFELRIPDEISRGRKDLTLLSAHGRLTVLSALDVEASQILGDPAGSEAGIDNEQLRKLSIASFNSKIVVYAKGYAGSRLSIRLGEMWVKSGILTQNFERLSLKRPKFSTHKVAIYVGTIKTLLGKVTVQ